jgi:hypothetical protein
VKKYDSLNSVKADYEKKVLDRPPLEKDAGGLGATRDSYEEKKRRRVPMPDEKKYNNY